MGNLLSFCRCRPDVARDEESPLLRESSPWTEAEMFKKFVLALEREREKLQDDVRSQIVELKSVQENVLELVKQNSATIEQLRVTTEYTTSRLYDNNARLTEELAKSTDYVIQKLSALEVFSKSCADEWASKYEEVKHKNEEYVKKVNETVEKYFLQLNGAIGKVNDANKDSLSKINDIVERYSMMLHKEHAQIYDALTS
jgi:DNA anti-recombination protein RmuC